MAQRRNGFIGVFDSGVGGISVLARLAEELPNENFTFYGDSANSPYGEKSREWVARRSREITDLLLEEGAKAIVIACNTATSAAAATLRADYAHVPIIGVEPPLKPATQVPGVDRILVMATPITLRLDKYQQLARKWGLGHEVTGVPCPGLADAIERFGPDDPRTFALLESLIGGYRGAVDAVVLGCTHYPFASSCIRELLGDVPLFDGAAGTARQLHRRLADRGLLSQSRDPGAIRFLTSDPDPAKLDLYRNFLNLAFA